MSEYHNELAKTLYVFQWIEELLRQYLLRAHLVISMRLEGILTFEPLIQKDLERDSLAQLLDKFKRLNSNRGLIDEIERLRPIRNHCAHRGYLVKFKDDYDESILRNEIRRLTKTSAEADACVKKLLHEIIGLEKALLNTKEGTSD